MALLFGVVVGPTAVAYARRNDAPYSDVVDYDDEISALTRHVLEYERHVRGRKSADGDESENPDSDVADADRDGVLVESTSDVLSRVLRAEVVEDAARGLAVRVLSSPEVLEAARERVRVLLTDLVEDPDTLDQLVALARRVLRDDAVLRAAVDLCVALTEDADVERALSKLATRLLAEDERVAAATQSLLTESVHRTLNDPDVLDHSMEFAADVVGDDVVQRTSGEALWNTISYSFRPGLASVLAGTGTCLVLASLWLLGSSTTRATGAGAAAASSDRAVGAALASIGRDGAGNVLAGPSGMLWTTVLAAPFRWGRAIAAATTRSAVGAVSACARAWGRGRNLAWTTTTRWGAGVVAAVLSRARGWFRRTSGGGGTDDAAATVT